MQGDTIQAIITIENRVKDIHHHTTTNAKQFINDSQRLIQLTIVLQHAK